MYILGYSGHAYVVINAILSNNLELHGYFDKKKSKQNPYRLKFLGFEEEEDVASIIKDIALFPAIGDNNIRRKAHDFLVKNKLRQSLIIDTSAMVSSKTTIDESSFVGPRAAINSMATIGKACIINTASIIEHQCEIKDYSHIAPGAILTGNVKIGTSCFIGAGAIIKQGVTIGNNVTIGAGAVVLNDISDNETWVGNPARRIT